ncbi:hypothetical protein LX32DRAFT_299444 [Colletotrichum zoysiae]|uniref:Uncharacterized protein n=1 Tax=Colletotrichum zoysiae TaxID=1216348 RepID=A0AAD9HM88_9PEZI|nr:hypothetical protein LX32DRAFT_299444 [Colletotrichum zoysiae]
MSRSFASPAERRGHVQGMATHQATQGKEQPSGFALLFPETVFFFLFALSGALVAHVTATRSLHSAGLVWSLLSPLPSTPTFPRSYLSDYTNPRFPFFSPYPLRSL